MKIKLTYPRTHKRQILTAYLFLLPDTHTYAHTQKRTRALGSIATYSIKMTDYKNQSTQQSSQNSNRNGNLIKKDCKPKTNITI